MRLLVFALMVGSLAACAGDRMRAGSGLGQSLRDDPEQIPWKRYSLTDDMLRKAPAWTRKEPLAEPVAVAVWNASGRTDDATDCFGKADAFRCLLAAQHDGKAARIDSEVFGTDSLVGWAAAVAPDHTMLIFDYDSSPCGAVSPSSRCGYSLTYFKCEVPAALEKWKLAPQRTLCSKPHYGIDQR